MRVGDYSKLAEPFPENDIEWRLARAGKKKSGEFWGQVLAYITSRAVQQRLDDVCGPDGWQTEIIPTGNGAYLCKLSIRFDYYDKDGNLTHSEWITRVDGSDESNIEAVKGGISGSVKRAAVQFGIGRYLYNLKDNWAVIKLRDGRYNGEAKGDGGQREYFKWDPPKLPSWALPKGAKSEVKKSPEPPLREHRSSAGVFRGARPGNRRHRLSGTAHRIL